MNNLTDLKEILYTMLETIGEQSDGQTDIKAFQNMGVELSNAVQKNGVNIVQVQSVVNIKLVPQITKALRLCDALEVSDRLLIDTPYNQVIQAADRIECIKHIEAKEEHHEKNV